VERVAKKIWKENTDEEKDQVRIHTLQRAITLKKKKRAGKILGEGR